MIKNNHQGPNFYFNKFCKLAKLQGGKVLSKKEDYTNAHNKLKIRCFENHDFEITLSNLNNKRWCPDCSIRKMEKYTKELVNILKPIVAYCKKTASSDGYQSWCKQCTQERKTIHKKILNLQ